MPIDKTQLISLLEAIDAHLPAKIRINAVGGTALTLLGIKTATIDIDFDTSSSDYQTLKKTIDELRPGYRIDLFTGGMIFSQQLPPDYLQKCIKIPAKLQNIDLHTICPLDIILSKTGRLNERDIQDIKTVMEKFEIRPSQVRKRGRKIGYVGNNANYTQNLDYVLGLFKKTKTGKYSRAQK